MALDEEDALDTGPRLRRGLDIVAPADPCCRSLAGDVAKVSQLVEVDEVVVEVDTGLVHDVCRDLCRSMSIVSGPSASPQFETDRQVFTHNPGWPKIP